MPPSKQAGGLAVSLLLHGSAVVKCRPGPGDSKFTFRFEAASRAPLGDTRLFTGVALSLTLKWSGTIIGAHTGRFPYWGCGVDCIDRCGSAFRYCPKCGAAALRFIGLKLVSCTSCGFELYLNAAAAVAALIADEQGRLLIVVRAEEPQKGMWDLPGGFADPGESAEETLRREVHEELGLELASMRYLCSYPNTYDYKGMRYVTMDLGFVCEVKDLAATRVANDEVKQVLFVRPEEIDTARFGFGSVGRTVDFYRTEGRAP